MSHTVTIRQPSDITQAENLLEKKKASLQKLKEDLEQHSAALQTSAQELKQVETWIKENPAPEKFDPKWVRSHREMTDRRIALLNRIMDLRVDISQTQTLLQEAELEYARAEAKMNKALEAYYNQHRVHVESIKTIEQLAHHIDKNKAKGTIPGEIVELSNTWICLNNAVKTEKNRLAELGLFLSETENYDNPKLAGRKAGSSRLVSELSAELDKDLHQLETVEQELRSWADDQGYKLYTPSKQKPAG